MNRRGEDMPSAYKIDKEQRLVTSTAWGVVTRDDVLSHQEKITADSDFTPTYSQLLDFTRTTKLEFTTADVQAFAARRIFAPTARRAIVVPDMESFGLARMFEILRDAKGDEQIRVFTKMEEARAWLGLA
jgi:hypothetical protein